MTRARANAMLVAAVVLVVMAGLVGCGGAGGPVPDPVAARRAEGEAERARLGERLEALEARLLDGRARVRAWQDLRERHQRVSEVACNVAGWHVGDMLRAREEEAALVRAVGLPRFAGGAGGGRQLLAP